jgi:hypothetical protein
MNKPRRVPRKPTKQPFLGCWRNGYAAGKAGEPRDPPYRHCSGHGGTWGYQANRAWVDGWETGQTTLFDDAEEE